MRICDTSAVPKKIVSARGYCKLEAVDTLTGKVKDRSEKENYVFQDVFQSANIGDLLNSAQTYTVLSSDNTPPDDAFPFVKKDIPVSEKNCTFRSKLSDAHERKLETFTADAFAREYIIGWGQNNTASDGGNRGGYRAADSYNGAPTPTGRSWRYVFDFTSTQALGTIKSVSVTAQFGGNNRPIRQIYYPSASMEAACYIYPAGNGFNGQVGYRVSNTGVVTKFNPRLNTKETVDVFANLGITVTTTNITLYYAQDAGEWFMSCYHATAANRRVFKFNGDFTALLNTYTTNAMDNNNNIVGVAYNNRLYSYHVNGQIWRFDPAANTVLANAITITAPPIIGANAVLSAYGSIYADADYAYFVRDTAANCAMPIIRLSAEEHVSWINSVSSGGDSTYAQVIKSEFSQHGTILVSSRADNNFVFRTALTKWMVPDGFSRAPGMGLVVDYQINVDYVV